MAAVAEPGAPTRVPRSRTTHDSRRTSRLEVRRSSAAVEFQPRPRPFDNRDRFRQPETLPYAMDSKDTTGPAEQPCSLGAVAPDGTGCLEQAPLPGPPLPTDRAAWLEALHRRSPFGPWLQPSMKPSKGRTCSTSVALKSASTVRECGSFVGACPTMILAEGTLRPFADLDGVERRCGRTRVLRRNAPLRSGYRRSIIAGDGRLSIERASAAARWRRDATHRADDSRSVVIDGAQSR
jgi:hypothetical protein